MEGELRREIREGVEGLKGSINVSGGKMGGLLKKDESEDLRMP